MQNNNQQVLTEYIAKAIELSDQCIEFIKADNTESLLDTLENRERVINIIQFLVEKLTLSLNSRFSEADYEYNKQVNQLISAINSYDEVILEYLQSQKDSTQNEIAKTFKNKENFKGYNLKTVK